MKKQIHIFGGGTFNHILSHFAVGAEAYGKTAHQLAFYCDNYDKEGKFGINLHVTRMAGGDYDAPKTNEDIAAEVEKITQDPSTKIIFFSCALTDYEPVALTIHGKSGRRELRHEKCK